MIFIQKRFTRWLLFALLLSLSTIHLVFTFDIFLKSTGIYPYLKEYHDFLLFISLGIQTFNTIIVLYFEVLLFFLLTKFILKDTRRLQVFYVPVLLSNIIGLFVSFFFNYFLKDFFLQRFFLLSFLSPVTLIKTLSLFFLCKYFGIWKNAKKAVLICFIYLVLGYLTSIILFMQGGIL